MFLPGFSVLMHYIEVLNNDVMCVVFDPGRAGICTLASSSVWLSQPNVILSSLLPFY